MSYSYTVTDTITFTRTHARHMAAKVATDLKRMQRFYGEPSEKWIDAFEAEAVEFLKEGLLDNCGLWLSEERRLDRADADLHIT